MKVAICFPHHGGVKGGFAESLLRMIIWSLAAKVSGPAGEINLEFEIFRLEGSALPWQRTAIVTKAVAWGAEFLFLVDADHIFPPHTLLTLLSHGKLVVGCNHMKRDGTGPINKIDEGLQQVEHMGLGLCLVARTAIVMLTEQAKRDGKDTILPLFIQTQTPEGGILGEDFFFFKKLQAAGVPLFIDHALSMEVGHIAETVLRFE